MDRIINNSRNSILFFIGLSAIFFIGLGNVHLFDWDEINFAESAREMIESGDYLRVQINFQPFWEKPPFFFWLQVGAMKLFGINEFAARFPNALFGAIYLITFYLIGKKHYTAKFGFIWALLFFGSLLPHLYFKSGIIDPVFNFFIFMSIYFMIRVLANEGKNIMLYAVLSGAFSGLSVITKGPVGFLLLGLTLFVYLIIRKFQPFPSFKKIVLFFAGFSIIIGSWLSLELYQNGWDVLLKFIQYQIELFNSPVAGHAQPFYYHFIVVFIGCFPLSIFALPSFSKSKEGSPMDIHKWMLCLFWVVIILFSITTTKIIHYSSMTYAPLSFLAALYMHKVLTGETTLKRYVNALFLIIGLIWSLIFIILPIILKNKEQLFPYINDPFAVSSLKTEIYWSGLEPLIGVLFLIGIGISFYLLKKHQIFKAIFLNAITLGLSLLLVLFIILPKIEAFTQGQVVRYYEELQDQDCYVESYGYKSYAQYFYFKQPFGLSDKRLDKEWLLNGDIDKPVYFISKSTNTELDEHPNFKLIKKEGGFRLYKRNNQ